MNTSKKNTNTWNEKYAIGIPLIDNQHQKFCEIIDKLSLIRQSVNPDALVKEIITELKSYSMYHFSTEEKLLTELSPSIVEQQIKQHQYFIKKVEEFEDAFRYKNIVLADQMHLFLKKWFLHHISVEDPKYVESVLNARPDLKH